MHSRIVWLIISCEYYSLVGFYPWCNLFLHIICSCNAMHCTSLFFLSWSFLSYCVFCFLFFSLLVSWLWHPKSLFLPRTQLDVVVLLHLLFLSLILLSSMMQNPKRISLRISMTGWFIQNARSFCLTFQKLLFQVHLALEFWNLYVRNPWGVPVCLSRSSTPTCMPALPLCLGLLQYFEVHVL